MRRIVTTAWLAAVLGCAGAPAPPAPETAICVQERGAAAGPPDVRSWTDLLLRGVDPVTQRATTPALDCTGAQIRWDGPVLACEDGTLSRTMLPDHAIVAPDVVVSPVSPDRSLVWIVTSRFASGDALGPVALVENTPRQLRVLAVGPLRAYPLRA